MKDRKKKLENEQRFKDMHDSIKRSNRHVWRVPEGEQQGRKRNLKK